MWEQGRGIHSSRGEFLGLEGFITDVSSSRGAQEEARRRLFFDNAAGLLGFSLFLDRLQHLFVHSTCVGYPFALLHLALDPLEEIDSLMIIGTNERNPQIFDPYRLNLNTGEKTLLCENPGDVQGWQTDHNGRLRVAYAIVDGVNSQIRYRETEAEPFRPVLTTNFKEGVSFATFTPDNKLVYAITNLGRDKSALVLMDPATCEELEQLYTNDKYDLRGIWYSDAQKKLQGVSYEGHKGVRRHFFDKATGEMFGRMEKHLRGYEVGISGWNKAEDKYIVYAGGDRTMVPVLARAAIAVGVAGVFMETHQDPDNAPSDGPNMIHLDRMPALIASLMHFDALAKSDPVMG